MGDLLEYTERKTLDLSAVIRTETVFSKLPFHNLSKHETLEILIAQEKATPDPKPEEKAPKQISNRLNRYELYWKVSPNPEYGEPRQLAYDLDTLIISKRLDEIGRPIPRRMKLGSLRGIARELGKDSTSTQDIKRALLQNSSAYVTLKIAYTAIDGTRRWAIEHNTRYGVSFRGTTGPDGTKTEAVFIAWNDPFLEILNSTKTRPVDYNYLRALGPTARRWYELVSFLFYAAMKNGHPYAEVRYSDYCKLAPQKRLTDRHKAQTQMGKLHRPHVASGYLAKVEYCATTAGDGNRDWILRYYPGPGAREEYGAFNGPAFRGLEVQTRSRLAPQVHEPVRNVPEARIAPNSTPSEADAVAVYFSEVFHQVTKATVPAGDRKTAEELLSRCAGDVEVARHAIKLAFKETREWNPPASNFRAVLSNDFPERAVAARADEEAERVRAENRRQDQAAFNAERQGVEEKAREEFGALSPERRGELVAEQRKKLAAFIQRMPDQWPPDKIEAAALHGYVSRALEVWARERFKRQQP